MFVPSLLRYFSLSYSVVRKTIVKGIRPGNPENTEVIELLPSLWELVEVVRDATVRWETFIP